MEGTWIVEVDMPGTYLLVLPHKIETTSDGSRCTRFETYEEGEKAAKKYYKGRQRLSSPRIFQPDWLKRERR